MDPAHPATDRAWDIELLRILARRVAHRLRRVETRLRGRPLRFGRLEIARRSRTRLVKTPRPLLSILRRAQGRLGGEELRFRGSESVFNVARPVNRQGLAPSHGLPLAHQDAIEIPVEPADDLDDLRRLQLAGE